MDSFPGACGIKVEAFLKHRKFAISPSTLFVSSIYVIIVGLQEYCHCNIQDIGQKRGLSCYSVCLFACVFCEGGDARRELQPTRYLHRMDEVSLKCHSALFNRQVGKQNTVKSDS